MSTSDHDYEDGTTDARIDTMLNAAAEDLLRYVQASLPLLTPPRNSQPPATSFGRELKRLRLKAGFAIDDIADRLLCSPSKINRLEADQIRPRPRDIRDLDELLETGGVLIRMVIPERRPIDPGTKMFLVALLWCRPLLLDPSGESALPHSHAIGRQVLDVVGARSKLERFDRDRALRDHLVTQVTRQMRALRDKVTELGLVQGDPQLSAETIPRLLIDNALIGPADLALPHDPDWRARQQRRWRM